MKMKAKFARIALAACLVLVTAGSPALVSPAEASSAPAYNAKLTQKNMLRLVRACDSDAYHILSAQNRAGDDFSVWLQGNRHLTDAVDTTVHEEFHVYTHSHGGYALRGGVVYPSDVYYLGGKKNRRVTYTKGFKTSRATGKIPKRYRTFRYGTYVAKGATASANTSGVYGLLNEFSAYYWGMHASRSLYPYLKKHVRTAGGYESFISNYMNDRDAYAEFTYWTYVYLDYARKHAPKTYKRILANKAYVKTFDTMHAKYKKLVKSYRGDLDKLCRKFNHGAGFSKSYSRKTGVLRFGDRAWMWPGNSYETLVGQLGSSKYQKVRKALANSR